jgi:hypothetical protein
VPSEAHQGTGEMNKRWYPKKWQKAIVFEKTEILPGSGIRINTETGSGTTNKQLEKQGKNFKMKKKAGNI